ncbi:FAD-binding protein [Yasminevirus sp. GU-2018]|uniref:MULTISPECIES: FAD-binding protein n=1 Tax=Yasminevirus sp. GU-2018 TaxID=2420051 RepID=A0A5K0U9Q3_9VIRU|nr:FAD-binding protein [Yasminevirus sp. GU-2018]
MSNCIPYLSAFSKSPIMPSESSDALKNILLNIVAMTGPDPTLDTLIGALFSAWTNDNFFNQVNNLLGFLTMIKPRIAMIMPGFDEVFDTLLLGFGGYLQIASQFPSPLKEGCVADVLAKLTKFWNAFVADVESGVIYGRSLPSIDPFIGQLLQLFPQYTLPNNNTFHSNYNYLIGASGNVLRPLSQADVGTILRKNKGKKVRPVSETSYSFNDLIRADSANDLYISLSNLNSIISIDTVKNVVRVEAGTPLGKLTSELQKVGKALKNLGNWDGQTVGGVLSTATHGSNAFEADTVSDSCVEIAGYNSMGQKVVLKKQNDKFYTTACSFGQILLITEVVFQIIDSFDVTTTISVNGTSSQFDVNTWLELIKTEKMTELDYFPSLDMFSLRRRTTAPNVTAVSSMKPFIDKVTGILREVLILLGSGVLDIPGVPLSSQPRVQFQQALIQGSVTPSTKTLPWNQGLLNNHVYGTSFPHSINNVEYAFDFTNTNKINEVINKLKLINSTYFEPLVTTFRLQGASKCIMAPHYGRRTLYLDIGYYTPNITQEQMKFVEEQMVSIGGRPHWGKWMCMDNGEIYSVYPSRNISMFKVYSKKNDPLNIFENQFINRVFKGRNPDDSDYENCKDSFYNDDQYE